MDNVEREYLAKAEALQKELVGLGFMATQVRKGDERLDYRVIFFDGTHEYYMRRDYQNRFMVSRVIQPQYPNVSQQNRREAWNACTYDNVKVLTQKKVQKLIDAENAYHATMEKLQHDAVEKPKAFIEEFAQLGALDGAALHFEIEKKEYSPRKGQVIGGEVRRNGVIFSFEIHDDGYVIPKMELDYKAERQPEAFARLTDNKYRQPLVSNE